MLSTNTCSALIAVRCDRRRTQRDRISAISAREVGDLIVIRARTFAQKVQHAILRDILVDEAPRRLEW